MSSHSKNRQSTIPPATKKELLAAIRLMEAELRRINRRETAAFKRRLNALRRWRPDPQFHLGVSS